MKKQNDQPERPRSQLLNAALNAAQELARLITEEKLPALALERDTLLSAAEVDAAAVKHLTERTHALLEEKTLLLRRIELLSQQKAQALKEEGELRIPAIVEELNSQSEASETLRVAWETALQSLVEATRAFLPVAQQRSDLLNEAEYLRLAYSTPPLPAITPLSTPSALELKAVTDTLSKIHGTFPDPYAAKKMKLREEQRLSAPPVPLDVRTQPGLVLEIEHPPAPATKTYDTSRYQVGEVHREGTLRPPSMAERKAE